MLFIRIIQWEDVKQKSSNQLQQGGVEVEVLNKLLKV